MAPKAAESSDHDRAPAGAAPRPDNSLTAVLSDLVHIWAKNTTAAAAPKAAAHAEAPKPTVQAAVQAEVPKAAVQAVAPKVDAAPKTDAPMVDAPKVDAPKAEAPKSL